MRRLVLLFGFSFALTLIAQPAEAGWHDWWYGFKRDYHRQVAWPQPFISADRDLARAPFAIMVNNGWRANNTLTAELFDADTQRLNHAGWLKVRWIATQAPVHRRTVFILRASSAEITRARVESVEQIVSNMFVEGPVPQVAVTGRQPHGISGERVDMIDRRVRANVVDPILPKPGGEEQ